MEQKEKESHQMSELIKLITKYKTSFCKHETSCLINCFGGAAMAFGKGFLLKMAINLIFTLFSIKKIKSLPILFRMLVNKTNFRLGLFIGLQTFLLKSIQCLMRIIRKKEDFLNSFLSGMIAGGVSFMTQEQKAKYIFRVYLFGRAVDCIYQSQIQKGRFKHHSIYPQITFSIMSMLIAYSFFQEPDCLPDDTFKMYHKFAQNDINDRIWHCCNVEASRRRLLEKGIESY